MGYPRWTRTKETVTPLGFKLRSGLHPAYELMRQGEFEKAETAVLLALFADCDRFVDVGANIGYFTCLAVANGRPVVAVEPQPQNLSCLFENLQANAWDQQVEVFPLALSERPGLLKLYGASGPSASLVKGWAGYSSRHVQKVAVSTLDNLLAGRFAGERLVVKIDVEGAEYGVLCGAHGVLSRTPKPAWLLEICLHEFHPGGLNPDFSAIFELFFSQGYLAYAVADRLRPITAEQVQAWWQQRRSDGETFNYLFVGPDWQPPASLC